MYSEQWLKNGCSIKRILQLSPNIFIKYWYNKNQGLVGITLDENRVDVFHYELTVTEWCKFIKIFFDTDQMPYAELLLRSFLDKRESLTELEKEFQKRKIQFEKQ